MAAAHFLHVAARPALTPAPPHAEPAEARDRSTYAEGPRASAAVVFKLFGKVMKMNIGKKARTLDAPHRRCFGSKGLHHLTERLARYGMCRDPRSSMSMWPSAVSWSPRASRRGSAARCRAADRLV